MHLRVAGLTIRATWAEGDLNLAPGRASARFLVEPSPPDVEIDVFARDLERVPEGECLFDSGGTWRLLRARQRLSVPLLFLDPRRSAVQDRPLHRRFLRRPRHAPSSVLRVRGIDRSAGYPLDELLFISLLGQGRGVEIHGCGVVLNGSDGLLFAGQSGAGKSTIARLCLAEPGAVVLSDDRVILREEPDGIWMYGTPWHGEEPLASPNACAPRRDSFSPPSPAERGRASLANRQRGAPVCNLLSAVSRRHGGRLHARVPRSRRLVGSLLPPRIQTGPNRPGRRSIGRLSQIASIALSWMILPVTEPACCSGAAGYSFEIVRRRQGG